MRRRDTGRDGWLTARMILVCAALALAYGRLTPGRATIVVTETLQQDLTQPELEAVLAHELSHVGNRDALVMAGASFFRTLAGVLDLRRLLSPTGGDAVREPLQLEDIGVWGGLRRATNAEAFVIVPLGRRSFEPFSDHPPLEKPLARLASIARELGEPVAV